MRIIEFVNELLGIGNDISVPLVVSVIFFVVAGIGKLVVSSFQGYARRRTQRKQFIMLLKGVVKNLTKKEVNSLEFSKSLDIERFGELTFTHKPISYLDILYQLDFAAVHRSFHRKFLWKFWKLDDRETAFQDIWDTIGDLKFIEGLIDPAMNALNDRYSELIIGFNSYHLDYQVLHESIISSVNGKNRSDVEVDTLTYLDEQEKIWADWHSHMTDRRSHLHLTYTHLILPMFELNATFPHVEYAEKTGRLIVLCLQHFEDILGSLELAKIRFEGFHSSYKKLGPRLTALLEQVS